MKKLLILTGLILLVGCKSVQPTIVHDTIQTTQIQYIDRVKTDSVYVHDSTFIYTKGDTVFYNVYKDKYKYLYKRDTINTTDTLIRTKDVVVEKAVKNPINKALLILTLVMAGAIGYYIYRRVK